MTASAPTRRVLFISRPLTLPAQNPCAILPRWRALPRPRTRLGRAGLVSQERAAGGARWTERNENPPPDPTWRGALGANRRRGLSRSVRDLRAARNSVFLTRWT